ncbi:PWWP domain-containing protein 5 [Malania oleifera]|uniref:PWWP domain-containing protein 5 n=1 Tax=Malania oleifera TaxID=397392 RepID=UPI0025AEBEB3|nr:PWWP domain-containing protein 5 [Malania oleifera]
MPVNPGDIDLNSDAVPGDVTNGVYEVNRPEPTAGPVGSLPAERVRGEIGDFGGLKLNDWADSYSVSGAPGVQGQPRQEAAVGTFVREGLEGSKDDDSPALTVIGALEGGDQKGGNEAEGRPDHRVESNGLSVGGSQVGDRCGGDGVQFVSMNGDARGDCFKVIDYVDYLASEVPGKEVKVPDANGFVLPRDQNLGSLLPEMETRQERLTVEVEETQVQTDEVQTPIFDARVGPPNAGSQAAMVGLAQAFNPYDSADAKKNAGVGIGSEGNKFEEISRSVTFSVSESLGEKTACYVDVFGSSEKQDVAIEEEGMDPERLKDAEMKSSKSSASGFEHSEKDGFLVSDLVWGKVRSHPWWPGQIFESSASSESAMKYFKSGRFLIAYFGDQTFAWNDASRLKPFRAHFSQMEKQSNMEAFQDAVDCALDEVSRRVEFGLSCSCLPEEVHAKIKSQIMVSAGIRDESSRRDGGDRFSGVSSFGPLKLVEYMKTLAHFPHGVVDRLDLIVVQAQLLAFYRWKGYPQLPEFKMLGGLFEEDIDVPVLGVDVDLNEVAEIAVSVYEDDEQVCIGEGRLEIEDSYPSKHEHSSVDGMGPVEKERHLSVLMADTYSFFPSEENEPAGKAGSKLISSSSFKKRRAVTSIYDDSRVKYRKISTSPETLGKVSSQPTQYPKVGESICRVASQLTRSVSIFKYGDEISQKSTGEDEIDENLARASRKAKRRRKVIPAEYDSADEMLSKLCLAARDPLKGHSSLISTIEFFSEFRNSISMEYSSLCEHKQSMEELSGNKAGLVSSNAETETPGFEGIEDSHWTDRVIQVIPEELSPTGNQNETGEILPEIPKNKVMPAAIDLEANLELTPNLDSKKHEMEEEMAVDHIDEACDEEQAATALILIFTNLDSVPSEPTLNKIFCRYGTLKESETKVMKKSNRAKVVFEKRSDAEAAFSSAGKFSIFGPSLLSYRLRYSRSIPPKDPSRPTRRRRKGATSVEGDTT